MSKIGVLLLGLSLSLSACSPSAVPRTAMASATPVPTSVSADAAGVPPQGITPLPGTVSPPTAAVPPDMSEFLPQTSPGELARQADLVVLGVTNREQVTGRLDPNSPLVPPPPPGHPPEEPPLYTETRVNVERVLKGAAPADGLRVRTLGGAVNG